VRLSLFCNMHLRNDPKRYYVKGVGLTGRDGLIIPIPSTNGKGGVASVRSMYERIEVARLMAHAKRRWILIPAALLFCA
jgi:hypothetical protein